MMKIVSDIKNDLDIVALPRQEIQAKINKELKYIGSILHRPGHTLFEINLNTGQIKEAAVKREVYAGVGGKPIYKSKVQIEKDCYYLEALNVKNAKKKFLKMIKSWKT